MLTTNIDIADRLINGQMGSIVKIDVNKNTKKPSIIYIKLDDSSAGKALIDKCNNTFVKQNRLVPIEPTQTRFKIRPGKPSSPEIQRMQFPITLAWACTVHKVQGLTLDKTVISFELLKQRFFNYGQVYVAISRSTTLQGIHILGQIEHRHVRTNPRVHEEYKRLRSTLEPPVQTASNRHMSITLLNVRSLKKHSLDIKCHFSIFDSDLIALTETQLLPQTNDNDIKDHLEPFTIYREDHTSDRFCSLAVCIKNHIHINEYQYFPCINAIKYVVVNNVYQSRITLLLLYRKHNSSIVRYVERLRYIINNHDIDIILGDFNINYFNDDEMKPLNDMMNSSNYTQVVQRPTLTKPVDMGHMWPNSGNDMG